jgi:hypothetical protein
MLAGSEIDTKSIAEYFYSMGCNVDIFTFNA